MGAPFGAQLFGAIFLRVKVHTVRYGATALESDTLTAAIGPMARSTFIHF